MTRLINIIFQYQTYQTQIQSSDSLESQCWFDQFNSIQFKSMHQWKVKSQKWKLDDRSRKRKIITQRSCFVIWKFYCESDLRSGHGWFLHGLLVDTLTLKNTCLTLPQTQWLEPLVVFEVLGHHQRPMKTTSTNKKHFFMSLCSMLQMSCHIHRFIKMKLRDSDID